MIGSCVASGKVKGFACAIPENLELNLLAVAKEDVLAAPGQRTSRRSHAELCRAAPSGRTL